MKEYKNNEELINYLISKNVIINEIPNNIKTLLELETLINFMYLFKIISTII